MYTCARLTREQFPDRPKPNPDNQLPRGETSRHACEGIDNLKRLRT